MTKSFNCSTCNKSFTRKSSLKSHAVTVHEKQRPYTCDVCPKKLSTLSSLKRHKNNVHNSKLIDVINHSQSECKRFRYYDNQVTFKIKPIPRNMNVLVWFYKVFEDILKYFKKTYNPHDDDLVGLTIRNSDFPKEAFISMRKQKELNTETVVNTLSQVCQSNADFNLVGNLHVCYKQIKMHLN